MHSVTNVEYSILFEPLFLYDEYDDKVILSHFEDLRFNREEPLAKDCILEHKVPKIRGGGSILTSLDVKGKVPRKQNYYNKYMGTHEFPNLMF